MSRRELHVFHEYRFGPRSVLQPGDRFRVTGGPVYVTNEGARIPMSERGVFVFIRYCTRGASRWIEAHREGESALSVLWVGRSLRSDKIPNLLRRPYRVARKLREKQRPRRKAKPKKTNQSNGDST